MKFYTAVDVVRGKICHSYYEDGVKHFEKIDFCPSLFIRSNITSGYKDLFNNNVEQLNFGSIKEWNQYKKNYKNSLDFYGDIESKYQFISEEYQDVEYDSKQIRNFLYDIEVINIYDDPNLNGFPKPELAKVPVVGIAIKDTKDKIMWVMSLVDYDPKKTIHKNLDVKKIIFKKFKTEEELLRAFIKLVEVKKPDTLIGYYNKGFDDPYILNRINQLLPLSELKKLSPSGIVKFTFKENEDGKIIPKVVIQGLQILDYLELYKKFLPGGRESFTLDAIAKEELGDEKVDYAEFDNLKDFYISDPQLATDYNIYDVELIDLLDKKLKLIELVYTMAYMSHCNFEDVLSPIKTWECVIYNYLKKDMIVIPPRKRNIKEQYPGAYVHDPIPGIYDWVITLDLASLYPHLIMQFNISTETLINLSEDVNQNELDERILNGEIKVNPDFVMAASGQYFSKDKQGLFPKLMEELYNKRKAVKAQMIQKKIENEKNPSEKLKNEIAKLNNIQMTFKLRLNSAYGAMASPYFRYYDIRLAKAITMSGQLAIRWIEKYLSQSFEERFKAKDKFLYADTDSVFYTLDFVVKNLKEKDPVKIVDLVDKFSKKFIEPEMGRIYEDMAKYVNANENKMLMKREKIIERYLITGKKHYAYLLWDNEGVRYEKPKMKVTGIEIVRSSTPKIIKPYLKEAIKKLMYEPDSVQAYIQEVKTEFMEFNPEDISFPRGVSNVLKYSNKATMYKKGTPIAVRAAIIYNNYIKKNNIDFVPINDGEKIRFIYTKTPNCFFNSNVFGFIKRIPNREEIVKYIDFNMQFDKVFFSVIKTIAERAGYEVILKPQTNLDELF